MEKIKIPQYLVRGKHRDFHVLCFPKLEHAWAYDEFDYQRYEIDGGYETYLWLKYAMAALIASPDKIIYFPIRKTSGRYLLPSYDAVFTRIELQFRRSEWVRLRSQLDKAHQIENYRLQYYQDKLCDALKSFMKPDQHGWHRYNDNYYRAEKKLKLESNELLGDTIFNSMIKENCYFTHADICAAMEHDDYPEYGFPVGGFPRYVIGFFLPKYALEGMKEDQEEFSKK